MQANNASDDQALCASSLVPLRVAGAKPPLFLVHGLLCDPGFANILSRELPDDQPIYTFAAVGMDTKCEPLRTIEAIAAHYRLAAGTVLDDRPFSLAGYCAGSLVAMEMAHQLVTAGLQPKRLFMIDFVRIGRERLLGEYKQQQLAVVTKHLSSNAYIQRNWPGWHETVSAVIDAAANYKVRPYAGPTCIVANRESLPRVLSPVTGWQGLVPPQTPVRIAGNTREDLLANGMPELARLVEQHHAD